jgi:hypothetical protein
MMGADAVSVSVAAAHGQIADSAGDLGPGLSCGSGIPESPEPEPGKLV